MLELGTIFREGNWDAEKQRKFPDFYRKRNCISIANGQLFVGVYVLYRTQGSVRILLGKPTGYILGYVGPRLE